MTKTTIFDTNKFANRIKTTLQQLESETDAKLSSLMMAEATSKVNGIDKISKNFHDAVKITSTDGTKIPKFPDEIYAAVMKRIVAVETPKFTSSSSIINTNLTKIFGTAGVTIVKQIGSYISDLLDSKSESISVDGTTYILSNPFGTTSSIVEVNIKDSNKKYTFSWNDDKATQDSFNSYMKSLAEYETENCLAVFFAILKDVKDIAGSSAGSSTNLLSKWSKGLMYGKKVDKYLSQLNDTEFFRVLSSYQNMPNESISTLIADIANVIIPIIKTHISLQSPNTKAKKWLDTYSKATETIEGFISWTEEIFDDDKKTISKITKKYNSLLDKSVALATFITKYDGSDESFIKELAKNSSTFGDFISAYNELETQIGRSKTSFASMLEDYTFYKITDVHDETISENHATIYGTNQNDTITVKGRNVKIYAGEGADRIIATSQYITLIGEQGNDHFMLNDFANSNYVDAGADDDTILSYSKNNTINGNSGNDSILVSAYSDFTTKNEVHGGAGDDTINVTAAIDNTVLGEEGNDFIQISEDANNNTIIGGKNSDTITIENSTRNFIVYSEGDGNDLIYGLGSTDTLYIAEGNFSQSTIGTDVLVSIGNGSILLKDAAGKNYNVKKHLTNEEWINEMFGNKVIFGTSRGDNIKNNVDSIIIDAGVGNDTIDNFGNLVTIDAGDGNDSICNDDSKNVSINAGDGDNSISNGYYKNYSNSIVGGDSVTIEAGIDDDYIYNYGGQSVKIVTNGGDNYIYNRYIRNSKETILPNKATIITGSGNDTISNYGDSAIIDSGSGEDSIYNSSYGSLTAINGDSGNDSILNDGNSVIIEGNEGNDYISNYGYSATINGGKDNDYIYNGGDNSSIDASAGNDSIYNGYYYSNYNYARVGNSVTINAEDGNNEIYNYGGQSVKITTSNGDNYIYNSYITNYNSETQEYKNILPDKTTIVTNEGNDTIYNYGGQFVKITTSGGDNYIYNRYIKESNETVFPDNMTICSGDGNDSITNYGSNVSIDASDGNNEIRNYSGQFVKITTNNSADYIYNDGNNSSIDTGDGNDSIWNGGVFNEGTKVFIDSGKGNDYISNSGSYVSINGNANDDTISNSGDNVTIDGDANDDFISNGGDNVSIKGGNDSDSISNSGESVTISAGAGNDSIYNMDGASLTANGGEGSDYIYNYYGHYATINSSDGNDSIYNLYSNYVTITAGAGDDLISLSSYALKNIIVYNLGEGNDIINGFNSTSTLSISGDSYSTQISNNDIIVTIGKGSITLVNATNLDELYIDGDKEDLTNLTFNNKTESAIILPEQTKIANAFERIKPIRITGNTLANSIIGGKGNDTLNGTKGNNTLTGGKGNDIFIYNDGNDIITDYEKGKDKISLDSASISNFTTINKDIIFALSNNNSLTLNNMADKQISFLSGSKTTQITFTNNASLDSSEKGATLIPATTEFSAVNYSGLVTINAENVSSAVNIIGNNKANRIIAGNYGSTLNGSKGKDSLIGGNGSDIFIYENKSGNKVIQNYSSSDTISLVGAQISDASIKSNDVILKVGSKKITVKGAASQEITISEDGTSKFFVDNILYGKEKTSAILSSKFSAKTEKVFDSIVSYIDASNAKKKLILTSGYSGSSTILGGKKNDSLTGNSGNDILYGGKGNDSLYGSSGNDTLGGEAGKDKLYGGNGNNTLMGGKGNDSLWGGNDTDTFIYSKGDGKDIIYGFDDTDILQITDTFSTNYNSSKSEIYFKVGSTKNAITLKNFTATNFNINNDSYQISGSTLVKK